MVFQCSKLKKLVWSLENHCYADDMQIYVRLKTSEVGEFHHHYPVCQKYCWMSQNFLKLNETKSEIIIFGHQNHPASIPILQKCLGSLSTNVKMGVIFDSDLSLEKTNCKSHSTKDHQVFSLSALSRAGHSCFYIILVRFL